MKKRIGVSLDGYEARPMYGSQHSSMWRNTRADLVRVTYQVYRRECARPLSVLQDSNLGGYPRAFRRLRVWIPRSVERPEDDWQET